MNTSTALVRQKNQETKEPRHVRSQTDLGNRPFHHRRHPGCLFRRGGSSPTAGTRAAKQPCALDQYRVISVTPYKIEKSIGGHILAQRVAGAEFFVEAQPGLTAEWLWLNLARQAAAMQGQGMKDCVSDITKLQVEVVSAGPGFRVRLTAPDANAGQEVLRRAQLLVS